MDCYTHLLGSSFSGYWIMPMTESNRDPAGKNWKKPMLLTLESFTNGVQKASRNTVRERSSSVLVLLSTHKIENQRSPSGNTGGANSICERIAFLELKGSQAAKFESISAPQSADIAESAGFEVADAMQNLLYLNTSIEQNLEILRALDEWTRFMSR
ncbi:hypothetical protein Cni_G03897 [Canna indica]|uniref:Uncharacterized protein n=1 Tax=Canna indica TaxID=4628 RepID=A0AAQ3Q1S4_9LILI|nr:hypothetical protein Cni_G03897 [Canna indica]